METVLGQSLFAVTDCGGLVGASLSASADDARALYLIAGGFCSRGGDLNAAWDEVFDQMAARVVQVAVVSTDFRGL